MRYPTEDVINMNEKEGKNIMVEICYGLNLSPNYEGIDSIIL